MTIQTQTHTTVKTIRPTRPERHGLGTASHRQPGRAVTATWERHLATAAEHVDAHDLAQIAVEMETGEAAFLAGIEFDDPIMTAGQRLGWIDASNDYQRGVDEGRWHAEGSLSQTAADRYRATGTRAYCAGFALGLLEARTAQRMDLSEAEQMDADEAPVGYWESRFPFLF